MQAVISLPRIPDLGGERAAWERLFGKVGGGAGGRHGDPQRL